MAGKVWCNAVSVSFLVLLLVMATPLEVRNIAFVRFVPCETPYMQCVLPPYLSLRCKAGERMAAQFLLESL
jgi:hypothetical protein